LDTTVQLFDTSQQGLKLHSAGMQAFAFVARYLFYKWQIVGFNNI